MAAASLLSPPPPFVQLETCDIHHPSKLHTSSSPSLPLRSASQHGSIGHVRSHPWLSTSQVSLHGCAVPSLNSCGLKICKSWSGTRLRFTRPRRGGGQIRYSAEARESSAGVGSSTDAWESGITFSSRGQSAGGGDRGERWTQSICVEEPTPNHSFTAIQQDTGIACAVLIGAYFWVRLFDFFTSKHIIGQKSSRKLIHITSGLLYMISWPFFSTSRFAPYIAGLVPFVNGLRLLIYGFGIWKDDGTVKTMSRSGDSRELLRGPLYYVVVLYISTVIFWRRSPVGMTALSLMCAGDGIADIMGRKFGSVKLPYNKNKSFAGSVAMFLFGFLVSLGCVHYFTAFGFFKVDLPSATVLLALISLAATVVESLPITARLDDNFTVPVTVFLLGILFFPL